MNSAERAPCPCGRADARGRPELLAHCCGRFLAQMGVPAPDAQALMRSRYSAFVLGHVSYLLATWHPSTRPGEIEIDGATKWLGLDVRDHRVTGVDQAEVEFVARYRIAGRAVRLHERSKFVREDGRWYYLSGDVKE
jgi:SEC-C motif-containing protein